VVDKSIGYELRCASPIPYDAEYARDLGYAAFNYLLRGGSNSMITIQGGEFRPIPFSQVTNPETGCGRQRLVDVETESYRVARDYMVRIGVRDFLDEASITKLAEAGGLTRSEFISRFGKQSHS
jgi:6-phosphofructokinase 1